MDTVKEVLEAMKTASKPLKSSEIVELSGIEKSEVDKAMKILKADKKIISPKRCYWEPV